MWRVSSVLFVRFILFANFHICLNILINLVIKNVFLCYFLKHKMKQYRNK